MPSFSFEGSQDRLSEAQANLKSSDSYGIQQNFRTLGRQRPRLHTVDRVHEN